MEKCLNFVDSFFIFHFFFRVRSLVTKQPETRIRTLQYTSIRLNLIEENQQLRLATASFERFEQDNGILFSIQLETSEVKDLSVHLISVVAPVTEKIFHQEIFLFVQLAVGSKELDAVIKSEANPNARVLDTHESRCSDCAVGRLCDKV